MAKVVNLNVSCDEAGFRKDIEAEAIVKSPGSRATQTMIVGNFSPVTLMTMSMDLAETSKILRRELESNFTPEVSAEELAKAILFGRG
jgi:hypothetical protein